MSSVASVIKSARSAYVTAMKRTIRYFEIGAFYSITTKKNERFTGRFVGFLDSSPKTGKARPVTFDQMAAELYEGELLRDGCREDDGQLACLM